MLRRAATTFGCLLVAGAIAGGCGGSGGGDTSTIESDHGPLAWLPADTWLVASVDASVKDIDTAIATLGRLPAWSLVESSLPADDGIGLRRALLRALAKEAGRGRGTGAVTAKELEAAFGDRVGFAIVDNDLEAWDSSDDADLPFVAWIEVDDEDAAVSALSDLTKGEDAESEHEGHTIWAAKDDDFAFAVDDGLAVITSSRSRLEDLIDVREGDDSLADDETGRAVIEAGIGDAVAGVAVQTDPLLAEGVIRSAAESFVAQRHDGTSEGEPDAADAKEAKAFADKLAPLLHSPAIDGLIPDWVSTSATIDETGVRLRGAWSNPRDLATPEIGSRELVERMPAESPVASAMVADGTLLGRVQEAWKETSKAYGLDLRSIADGCEPDATVFCELAAEAAVALLEDTDLASALDDAGDQSTVIVQDIGAALAGMTTAAKQPTARTIEIATSGGHVEWTPPTALTTAMRKTGLVVITKPGGDLNLRVLPGSPLDAWLREFERGVNSRGRGAAFNLDMLRSPAGITIKAEAVDGIRVIGFPQDAPSKVVPALEGKADTLGEADTYGEVIAAAKPPKQVGAYGWLDVRAYVEAILSAIGSNDPSVKRMIPTIRNNLADAPGIVWWSSRDEIDGEQVGVFEMSLPILK